MMYALIYVFSFEFTFKFWIFLCRFFFLIIANSTAALFPFYPKFSYTMWALDMLVSSQEETQINQQYQLKKIKRFMDLFISCILHLKTKIFMDLWCFRWNSWALNIRSDRNKPKLVLQKRFKSPFCRLLFPGKFPRFSLVCLTNSVYCGGSSSV